MEALQRVLEASPDAILLVDERGRVLEANQNVEAVLGYTPDELEGMVVETLLLDADREDHVAYRERYMEDPEPRPMGRELDLKARRKDGRPVLVEISLGPIENDGRQLVMATVADISRRKAMEQQLRQQTAQLEELVGIVSHDLRNPLSVVLGWIELAIEDDEISHLEQAEAALFRMQDIVEDTLTLAKWGRAVDPADREPLSLAAMARACWTTVDTDDATLDVADDVSVVADSGRLRHLLENLFRNAVEHAGADATVRVGALPEAAGFYVEDDGPGIPVSAREQVFEPGHTTAEGGTGFGLAIVKRVAAAHGWSLEVTDGAAGGARFEVRFETD
jgi:PAS domain S-box-containing protein